MMKPTAAWLSVTGSVFGIAHTAVNPPAAAARAPEAIVSTSSRPGSRRWQCTSMNPGRDHEPGAVDRLQTVALRRRRVATRGPMASIFPSTISTSAVSSIDCDGSITRPPMQQDANELTALPPPRFAASASSGSPPDSRYSTAMRTATPFVT